jgi:F-type H+-transporting ATPase subunit a
VDITPDQIVLWQWGRLTLNATILWTWVVMAVLAVGSWAVTRGLTPHGELGRGQNVLEGVVSVIERQIRDVERSGPAAATCRSSARSSSSSCVANVLSIVPGYRPPTGSLSTTAALALCVFVAVPIFGIRRQGLRALPAPVRAALGRDAALHDHRRAVAHAGARGPALRQRDERHGHRRAPARRRPAHLPGRRCRSFGLLIGVIQAYIFAILAMVYIASATRAHDGTDAGARKEGRTLAWITSHSSAWRRSSPAGLTMAIGSIGPALGQGRAVAQALSAIAQQPDEANSISRTLFIGLAMVESTGIYCFVIAIILLFANPFWNAMLARAG